LLVEFPAEHQHQDIAQYIKKEVRPCIIITSSWISTDILQFDQRKGATWHCIVGRNFGSFVTHGNVRSSLEQSMVLIWSPETKHFIYFYLGHCAILLFKTQ